MKKLLVILTIAVLAVSCGEKTDSFVLNGTLRGDVADGTQVFLKTAGENNSIKEVDTVTVKEGKFVFNTPTPKILDPYYVFIDKVRGNMMFFPENGTIEMSAHRDSLRNVVISGTPQNDMFSDFIEGSKLIGEKVQSIQQDYQKAAMAKDTATVKALQDEIKEIQEEGKDYEINFTKANPNAVISAMIINRLLMNKILTEDEISELVSGLSEEVKQTAAAKSVLEIINKNKATSIGAKAPEFTAPSLDGTPLALNKALGKVTIVDFWAAWCVPCRRENPNVVNVYNKYHDKGLNIVGVSLDKNATEWKKAIEEDGLPWSHVYNEKDVQEIAKLYNVTSIPSTFILDEKGVIIAKNLRGDDLENKIAELLQ
ncbi:MULTISPECIES: TlpA disulfide reductase family protein [unclassified Cellulophaga]|uniref:TlpA disulfide reductase family protein n=1 Tax=unclassified Cellulophaga TaxID=2634405 RepID=UPI0026E41073|nr:MULTISPECIES: TlpA disulfide reductase family protein [unclassified Cellulophaga]MDO6491676.1 TlpA disulfide reductase family protein [Cellulophaga sp. 2_MG-2023]MDO6493553.1 TlpA disulfide reductase family protein [Cellulophaga sp. 3_MG-2023]